MLTLLDSLDKQQGFNFEFIVVTRSRYDTEVWQEYLALCSFEFQVYEDLEVLSRAQAFKVAFWQSRAPWQFVLDADDFLQENAIPYAYWIMRNNPEYKVFCSNHAECDEQGKVFAITSYDPHEQRPESLSINFKQRHLWGFHRDVLLQVKNALDSPWLCEDYWFFSRLAMHSVQVLHIPKTLYFYRRHALQMTQVYHQEMTIMCKSIQHELHRWVCSRSIGNNIADGIQAERIVRLSKKLLHL